MDHQEAVRQNATEKYLLDELDPELRDQFEEHLFDCQDCALDVRAGAMLPGCVLRMPYQFSHCCWL
jgi:anti-sigma factor RsiW